MIQPYVRASYAIGYAEYGAEPSQEAVDQCAFLIEVAPVYDGAIVEATRDMAKFQGLKDTLTMRRDALFTKFNLLLKPELQKLAKKAPQITRMLMPKEDDQSDILKALKAELDDAEWQQVLQQAWIEANAEGNVGAQAFIAAARNEPNIAFDQQFPQAVDAMHDLQLNDANAWIDKQLNGLAYFTANDVGDAIANGASYDDLLAIVQGALGSGEGADLMLDTMISTGVSAGSIDLYQSEGLEEVDIITSAIDDECSDAADQNPWPTDEADGMLPFHPNCRCAVAPHLD